ncbi:MAG: hypothetical protein ACTSRA_10435 [Promethearchaeota archaeon]
MNEKTRLNAQYKRRIMSEFGLKDYKGKEGFTVVKNLESGMGAVEIIDPGDNKIFIHVTWDIVEPVDSSRCFKEFL